MTNRGIRPPGVYGGPDRRTTRTPCLSVRPSEIASDAAALLAGAGALTLMVALASRRLPVSAVPLTLLLSGLGSGLCFVIAAQSHVRWRLVGDAVAARVAVAFVVYGSTVVPLAATRADGAAGGVGQILGTLGTVAILLSAARCADVDADFAFARRVALPTGLATVAILVTAGSPAVGRALLDARVAGLPVLDGLATAVVVLASGALTATGLRRGRRVLTRCATSLALLVVVPVVASTGVSDDAAPLMAATLQLSALVLVATGTARDTRLALSTAGRYNAGLGERWRDALARVEGIGRITAERNHEIRSALLAIEGASEVLSRHCQHLGVTDDAELAAALHQETARLQQFLSSVAEPTEAMYVVADVIEPLVVAHRSTGQRIHLDVPRSLRVVGHPHALAEAVTNLLVNAAVHAPGAQVRITVADDAPAGAARLRVADDGPGFGADALTHALERGWRGPDAEVAGKGIGLYLAARLLQKEGGALALVPESTGSAGGSDVAGAVITVDLPLARSAPFPRTGELKAGAS